MVRRNQWTWIASGLGLVLAMTASAQAQFQGRGGGGFGGRQNPLGLIRSEAVQKELNLSDEARTKLSKLAEDVAEETRAEMQKIVGDGGFQNLSPEERQEMQKKIADMTAKISEKVQPQLKETLSAEQQTRLKQIGYQVAGVSALSDAEVAKTVGITADQQKQIATTVEEFGRKQRELFQGGGGEGIREKMQELNKERDEKVLGILSADQKAEFEKIKGKPFDVSQLRGGFGPGGGNRPGGKPGAAGRPGGKPGGEGRPGRPGRPNAEGKPGDAPRR